MKNTNNNTMKVYRFWIEENESWLYTDNEQSAQRMRDFYIQREGYVENVFIVGDDGIIISNDYDPSHNGEVFKYNHIWGNWINPVDRLNNAYGKKYKFELGVNYNKIISLSTGYMYTVRRGVKIECNDVKTKLEIEKIEEAFDMLMHLKCASMFVMNIVQ